MGNMVNNHSMPAMAILCLLILFSLNFADVAQAGVCYGRLGNDLPSPPDVIALYQQNNIDRMRIYDPDHPTLEALRGTNIELMLGVPNTDLQQISANQANADSWVQNNVKNYPNVRFRYIAVGNEVSPLKQDTAQYVSFVFPALQNIQKAISSAGLSNQIKVSTAIETGLVANSYPPSDGVFRTDATAYINPIINFLVTTGSPLLVNIYPYFAHIGNKAQVDLQYALLQGNGVVVPGGVKYDNLFYAMVDSVYAALEKSGGSAVEIVVSESGWPSAGGDAASVENERIYSNNLIQKVKNGTPKRPGRPIVTYIFAMFDENQKDGESEKHFGVFLPNRQKKFPITFN